MTFFDYHGKNRKLLIDHINTFFSAKESDRDVPLAALAMKRLHEMCLKGKLLRGGFVMFAAEMYGQSLTDEVLNVATAMEVSQSAILTHDDIMDNDHLRRGVPTIFAQYEEDAHQINIRISPEEYGKSMAMGVGDIGILLTHELLAIETLPDSIRSKIMREYSTEMTNIWKGQFLDYTYGVSAEEQSTKDIEEMYRLKTGSYTFTLPFTLGALLADISDEEIEMLQTVTLELGTVFQIKDDELGLFGDPEKTGKPRGSDLEEHKKTLIRAALIEKMNEEESKRFPSMDVEEVCAMIERYGIHKEMQKRMKELSQDAEENIRLLAISNEFKALFLDLVEYNMNRDK